MDWTNRVSFFNEVKYAFAKWGWLLIAVICLFVLVYAVVPYIHQQEEERKNTICPSYLSIARSSRDTLIIMHNDYLCNEYVLEHL